MFLVHVHDFLCMYSVNVMRKKCIYKEYVLNSIIIALHIVQYTLLIESCPRSVLIFVLQGFNLSSRSRNGEGPSHRFRSTSFGMMWAGQKSISSPDHDFDQCSRRLGGLKEGGIFAEAIAEGVFLAADDIRDRDGVFQRVVADLERAVFFQRR